MAREVNIYEAKSQLSRLLQRVQAGEEVVIAKAGHPIARLVPVEPPRTRRRLGRDVGRITISDDFDAPLDDIEDAMYGADHETPA